MSNPKKQKGTLAETALVKYLNANGFPNAERRALAGTYDLGDIIGTVGICWEVKNHGTYRIGPWLEETKAETKNSDSDYGILAIKPNRVGIESQGDWWAVMPMSEMVKLLRDAGYGDKNANTRRRNNNK